LIELRGEKTTTNKNTPLFLFRSLGVCFSCKKIIVAMFLAINSAVNSQAGMGIGNQTDSECQQNEKKFNDINTSPNHNGDTKSDNVNPSANINSDHVSASPHDFKQTNRPILQNNDNARISNVPQSQVTNPNPYSAYRINLDSFKIIATMSTSMDTDYVAAAARGSTGGIRMQSQYMGDRDEDAPPHPTEIVLPSDQGGYEFGNIRFAYIIINHGGGESDLIHTKLQQAAATALKSGIQSAYDQIYRTVPGMDAGCNGVVLIDVVKISPATTRIVFKFISNMRDHSIHSYEFISKISSTC